MKRLSVFIFSLLVFAPQLHAETTVSSSSGTGTNTTAKKAGSSAKMAQLASAAAGATFMTMCSPEKPIYCALGAANIAQAMVMGGGAKNAKAVDSATLASPSVGGFGGYNTGELGTTSGGNSFDGGSGGDFLDAQIADLQSQYEKAGYVVSPDGSSMTLPGGSTVSTAALAGGKVPGYEIDDGVKSQMDKVAEDAMKKASGAKVVAVGLSEGGGGGGSGGNLSGEGAGSRFSMADYLKGLNKRDPSSVTGLSKKLGEDNIGIKSDNIFEMVSRQYKRKQTQRAFMN